MKMIKAIVRPEKLYHVLKELGSKGFYASTKWQVSGRGRQKGIQVGDISYDEILKSMIEIIVADEDKNKVIDIIIEAAITSDSGNSGDGKIFVLPVEESYTISKRIKDE